MIVLRFPATSLLTAPAPRFVALTQELLTGALLEDRDIQHTKQSVAPVASFLGSGTAHQWAMIGRGHVLAAGGLIQQLFGCAELWLLVSHNATHADRAAAIQHCGAVLDQAQQDPTFRRVSIPIHDDEAWLAELVKALGFSTDTKVMLWDVNGDGWTNYVRIVGVG